MQMNKKYGLTGTEELIMEILWNAQKPMTVKEILDVALYEWDQGWKVQTLNTFLSGLQKMDLVEARREVSCNVYYAICTREQQMHKWTKKIEAEFYDNSIGKFVKLFIGEGRLSEKDADELRKLCE